MRLNGPSRIVGIALLVCVVSACGQRGVSPLSPSALSPQLADTPRSRGTFVPRGVDCHVDEEPTEECPMDPGADPGTTPPSDPGQLPPPDGAPAPIQLTISIVGSFGNLAFAPNPQQAAIGNMVVWANNDLVQHTIVLDDGTPVGTLAPGQSSTPIALITETTGYHCTLHPSMVGQIVPIAVVPPDGQAPVPPGGDAPMPNQPEPGYGDEYDYGYMESGKWKVESGK